MSERADKGGRWEGKTYGGYDRDQGWSLPGAAEPEESSRTARERRVARDNRIERVRAALRAASEQHGYYVFDELMTGEAGKLDFLAVGPPGAVAIVMRDEDGVVSVTQDGELLLDGRLFDESPRAQMTELGSDVAARVNGTGGTVATLVCFSHAEVEYPEDLELLISAEVSKRFSRIGSWTTNFQNRPAIGAKVGGSEPGNSKGKDGSSRR